jgi:2Fe-2S ferredoxin
MYKIIIREADSGARRILTKIQPYQTLLEICLNHHIELRHQCGGVCHCTTCLIEVVKGGSFLDDPSKRELDFLKRKAAVSGSNARLGCQSMLIEGHGEIEILIPKQDEF